MSLKKVLFVVVVVLGAASASRAEAQIYNGYNAGFFGGLPYSVYVLDSVPYYALHPPVYYSSRIVPRPYGYSPYAYPPGIMTPDHPPGTREACYNSAVQDRVAARAEPLTIMNPYATEEVAASGLPAPRRGRPAPKTIRPITLAKSDSKRAG